MLWSECSRPSAQILESLRDEAVLSGAEYGYDIDSITKELKAAASITKSASNTPSPKKPIVYKTKSGGILKHSVTNKGGVKLELNGIPDEQVSAAIKSVMRALQIPEK